MRRRSAAIVVAAISILLGLWVFGLLPLVQGAPDVHLVEYCGGYFSSIRVTYAGNDSNFIVLNPIPLPQWCSTDQSLPPHSQYQAGLELNNSDNLAHQIIGIDVGSPFSTGVVSPRVPVPLGAHQELGFTIMIQVPSLPGYYSQPSLTVSVE